MLPSSVPELNSSQLEQIERPEMFTHNLKSGCVHTAERNKPGLGDYAHIRPDRQHLVEPEIIWHFSAKTNRIAFRALVTNNPRSAVYFFI